MGRLVDCLTFSYIKTNTHRACSIFFWIFFTEAMEKINNGMIPLLFVSPEGLFSGSWRDLIMTQPYQQYVNTVVIDECHCVQQW